MIINELPNKKSKNEEHNEEDRLSSLPGEIIVDILSLIPFKSAVITDALSRQWRGQWTQIYSSLIELELGTPFTCWLTDTGVTLNLPNLKKLSLYVTHSCFEIAAKLIKCCLTLEELFYSVNHTNETEYCRLSLDISCQTLKRLSMELNYVKINKIVIDANRLAYLSIKGFRLFLFGTCNVDKPLMLHQEYKIRGPDNNIQKVIDNQQSGSSEVGKICNILSLVVFFNETDNMKSVPMFRNLTRLELRLDFPKDCHGLMLLVNCCPNLEVLILEIFTSEQAKALNKAPQTVDTELLNNIKRIQIKVLHGLEDYSNLIELVKYLMRCSKVLELFHLSVVEVDVHTEGQLCEHLHSCPRISSGCTVKFTSVRL